MSSIQLSGLTTYPIKSAAGIDVSHAQVTSRGLEHDRRWMICDRSGKFLTQRKLPRLALIQVAVKESSLCLSLATSSRPPLELPAVPTSDSLVEVEVWGDVCVAWSMGDEAEQWLSQFLECEAQLVYMPDNTQRAIDHGRFDMPNSFADAYPFLLLSEASLANLNSRLEQPVPMNRFRPNLVVTGCEPFAEDTWQQLRIGKIVFDVAKACSRCSIPGVEQSTGEQGKEPLKTLATFRRWDLAIWFFQNLIAYSEVSLKVGDEVEVLV